jgi:hypothetical protein
MVLWGILLLIVLVALAIPILAIVLESPVVRRLVRRLSERSGGGSGGVAHLAHRIESLETDVQDLTQSVEALREETEFVRRLLDSAGDSPASRTLPRPDQ